MNQKELMLQGRLAKAKTHTITVGYNYDSSHDFYSYGFLETEQPLGNIIPQTFLQTIILAVYSYHYGSGAPFTDVILGSSVQGAIRITRLDTEKSIMVPAKGEGSYSYFGWDIFPCRRRQNHRPDYRSCVASNATSLKEVA